MLAWEVLLRIYSAQQWELARIIGFDCGMSVAGIQGSVLSVQLHFGVIERSNSGKFWS